MATPLTELRLLNNLNLDTTYNNTFSKKFFGSLDGQITYYKSKTYSGMTFQNLTFQRKEKTIKIKKRFEDIESLSYGMFQNNTNSKWYYFFITDIMYVSDLVTEIKIEIDVEQTYLYDITFENCFVEREHVSSDTVGTHTVPEGLETGEMTVVKYTEFKHTMGVIGYALTDVSSNWGMVNNVFNGLFGYADNNDLAGGFRDFLDTYVANPDNVVYIVSAPEEMVGIGGQPVSFNANIGLGQEKQTQGYYPRNNKLFTYPYNYVLADDFNGQSSIYNWENFDDPEVASFNIQGVPFPKPATRIMPADYRQQDFDQGECIIFDNFPLGSWTSSSYRQWVAQGNLDKSLFGIGVGLATNVSTGNLMGIVGSLTTAGNTMFEAEKRKRQGNSFNGTIGSASVNIGSGNVGYRLRQYSVKKEYSQIIDDFFTKYGYKVNEVKTPNVTSRSRHNYLQTQDTIIKGNIPREALTKLISNREKGITFWHVDDIGNYTPTNAIT